MRTSVIRLSPAVRISVGLVLLTISILFAGDFIGLVPDRSEAILDARKKFCETLALQLSLAVQKNDLASMQAMLQFLIERNEDVFSAALRTADGAVLAQAGDHQKHWQKVQGERSTPTHAQVPIFKDDTRWATVEVRFSPIVSKDIFGIWPDSFLGLLGFVALAGFIGYLFFMKRNLRHLDPSAIIPRRVQLAFDVLAEGVMLLDQYERIVLVNSAFVDKAGLAVGSLLGKKASELNWTTPKADQPIPTLPWLQAMDEGQAQTGIPLALETGSKEERLFMVNGTPILGGEGNQLGALVTFDDVTEMEKKNEQLRKMLRMLERSRNKIRRQNRELQLYHANYDTLTHLPNRHLLQDRLQHIIQQARRTGDRAAVLFFDLDRFGIVNDSLGHSAGDALLQAVAARLTVCVRTADTVARLGSDEFVIVLERLSQDDQAVTIAGKILEALQAPFTVEGQEFFVNCSIGMSLFPKDGEDAPTLLKNANTALHRVKARSGNGFEFYSEAMNARTDERLALEADLHRALEREELTLYYQPQVDTTNGNFIGLEALLRWQHPERGMISPAVFIPLAEETGLITPIGDWVLRTACAQAKAWQEAGITGLHVAVNLSAHQFMQADLTDRVAQALADTGLEASYLELEITESLLMQDVERAVMTLRRFKAMGIQLAIDDFGTGYSSLSYLKRFPLDRLKIDRSFVLDITTDTDAAAIASAVIALAHTLKLEVVAEGVETEAQLAFLRARHCDVIQGYYISRPLPPQEVAALLQRQRAPELVGDNEESHRQTVALVDD